MNSGPVMVGGLDVAAADHLLYLLVVLGSMLPSKTHMEPPGHLIILLITLYYNILYTILYFT